MKDAYWFSHDSNAKDDPKCVLLIEQLGLEGYGIYWVLVETLREQSDYKYPLILLPALARRFNTSTEKIKAVVINYKLFSIQNDEFFISESLIQRMNYLDEKRQKRSIAGQLGNQKRWGIVANESQCDGKASLSKVNESKVNESKVKFDEFRKLYQGTKRGNQTEFENFIKKHKDWEEVINILETKLKGPKVFFSPLILHIRKIVKD